MEGLVTLGLLTELAVQRFGRADLFWAWAGANRHVPRDLASSNDRRGIGAHPVIPAVFAPVFDQGSPGFARLQCFPHVCEGLARHVRMAHDVVHFSSDLIALEPTDLNERGIRIGDATLRVSGRHQCRVSWVFVFVWIDWNIDRNGVEIHCWFFGVNALKS